MDEKLKPCPKCGNHMLSFVIGVGKFAVLCEECGEETCYFDAKDKAVEAWNMMVDNAIGGAI